jgi:hypothetical protein
MEGEPITLDSNSGHVFEGEAEIVIEYPTQWLQVIRKWQLHADTRKSAESARGSRKQ